MLFLAPHRKNQANRRFSHPRHALPTKPAKNRYVTYRHIRHLDRLFLLALVMIVLAACAPGEPPPAAICDTYDRALFTTQLMGGAAVLLGLAVLGFRKNLSAILPSQGAQIGAVAASIGLGLILLAFSWVMWGQWELKLKLFSDCFL